MDLPLSETISGALGTYYFKNTMCFALQIGHWMKLCDRQCTVLMFVLLSISHTFLWENDNKISGFCVCVVSPISEYDLTLTSNTQFYFTLILYCQESG